jgi:small-conductance mechanosensitive channel
VPTQECLYQANTDRFKALLEKYTAGEVVAQRLLILFARLQRERNQYSVERAVSYEGELQTLNDQLFELEDKLYEFDYETQHRLQQLTNPSDASVSPQQTTAINRVQPLLDQQKTALRDQQQTLAALGQELTTLIALDGEDKRQLDESYLLALTTLFWLRDGKPLSGGVLSDMVSGGRQFAASLIQFTQSEFQRLLALAAHNLGLWALAVCLFILLPWLAYRGQRKLHFIITSPLNNGTGFTLQRPWVIAIFILIWAAIWPLYLVLLASIYGSFSPPANQQDLPPVTQALELTALFLLDRVCRARDIPSCWMGRTILGASASNQPILRSRGVGCYHQRNTLPRPPLRSSHRAGRYSIRSRKSAVCPHIRPARRGLFSGYCIRARQSGVCTLPFLLFQLVVLVLIGVIRRRSGPLTAMVLGTGRHDNRLLWRAWPILHATILVALVSLIGLDLVGYRYAARFFWLRLFSSLGVFLGLWLLVVRGLPIFERGARKVLMQMSRGAGLNADTAHTSYALATLLGFVGRGILLLIAGIVLLVVWGVPVAWVLSSRTVWQIVKRTVVISVVAGITIFVIRASRLFTTYLLTPPPDQPVESYQASRKVKTLAPLVQTLIQVIVIFAGTLLVLKQFGINTGPVLAGAGILGLAVGFASQSLIKDVINGLFILFEDSLSVGDVVKLRNINGQVEKFTLRAVTLRDVSGSVHIIPNSAINIVTNMTKDYSCYVLDVGVAYGENIKRAVTLLEEIGDQLRRDPQYGRDMLEPMEVMGVERFTESAVVIRVRLKTHAMRQWRIGREFNRRMKNVFEEQGIEVPLPQRSLQWGNPVAGAEA